MGEPMKDECLVRDCQEQVSDTVLYLCRKHELEYDDKLDQVIEARIDRWDARQELDTEPDG